MLTEHIIRGILAIVPVILAITLHEVAHGYAALALGDHTARDQQRLSLNPLRHVDRMGTIVLPGFLLISQLLFPPHKVQFMFGWAKPVPVNPMVFRDPRRGMALVALAGPAMNFFLVWVVLLAIREVPEAHIAGRLNSMLYDFILVNMVLGLFNLLPVPPLDGGRVMVGLLPEALARSWAGLERYGLGIILVFVLVLPQVFGISPINDALEVVLPAALTIIQWLAGYDV